MYKISTTETIDKIFSKLAKKDKQQMNQIIKKIEEISQNPYRYKNLRAPLNHLRRIHIGSFVLVFSVDEENKTIILNNYEHHDTIYV